MGNIEITATGASDTKTSAAAYPYNISGIVTAIRVDFTGAPNTTTVVVSAEGGVASSITLLSLSAGNTSATYYPTIPSQTTAGAAVQAGVVQPIYIDCTHLKVVIANGDSDTVVVVRVQLL